MGFQNFELISIDWVFIFQVYLVLVVFGQPKVDADGLLVLE
jgi:hypothetical protein